MTLRRTLAARVGAVTLLFAVLAAALAGWASARGFRDVDERDAVEDAIRVERAVEREIEQLSGLALDWAAWDDTLRYVTTGDPGYADSNLVADTLETLELSAVIIAGPGGRVFWASGFDAESAQPIPVDVDLLAAVEQDGALHATDLDDGYSGPLLLGSGPVLVASRPITDSTRTAPTAGTLVMVRRIDDTLIDAISDRVRRPVAIESSSDSDAPTATINDDHVLTRVGMTGVNGDAVADLVLRSPRQATAIGLRTIGWMSLVLLGTVALAGVTTFVVIDRALVQRLVRTRDGAVALGQDGAGRLEDDGRADELSDLRAAINETVASLEETRADLAVRNRELLELARFRKDLIGMVSHELRAPLAAIRGFAQTLDDRSKSLDEGRREHLMERIRANADRLNTMVNDLLLIASADDGGLPTNPTWVPVRELLDELHEDLEHEFTVEVPEDTAVVCDEDHLRRIVINLVSNAHAHGDGPVHVTVARDGQRVQLDVRDHGPGVPPGFVPQLFDRFSQSPTSIREQAGGVGLGLSIVHALADANGGSISYTDASPGARFTVELPASERAATDATAASVSRA